MEGWFPRLDDDRVRAVGRPLLAVSDIHGDLVALESVLAAVKRVPLSGIVAAGDHCFGGEDPFGVWQRLHELGACLVRGETDLALASFDVGKFRPQSHVEEEKFKSFIETREKLGEIVCRRLGELPVTAVVSLDDRSGVMAVHASPRDPWGAITSDLTGAELEHEVQCAAEDVLVVGKTHKAFARKTQSLLVVNAGAVGNTELVAPSGRRLANAALIQEFTDGVVRALVENVVVKARPRRRTGTRRRAG